MKPSQGSRVTVNAMTKLEKDLLQSEALFKAILAEAEAILGPDQVIDCVRHFGEIYGKPIPADKRIIIVAALACLVDPQLQTDWLAKL